jgi:ABC-2 type transport system permease protein
LLANGWQLALRQNAWTFASWAAAALGMTALMASLATIAVDVTSDSENISSTLSALAGNKNDLQVAFLGAGLIFLVMLLMIMATTVIGAIRGDEAKQYLDSILVNPHKRTTWLAQRLLVGVTAILLVALAAGLITYGIGRHQDIVLNFGKVMATSLSVMGTVVFLLGLGALIYGLLPRLATPIMYLVFGWSFLIILLSSAMHLSSVVLQSSLFHYTSFNLADWPDWATLYWLVVLGFFMAVAGVVMFNRRDIITE